MSAKVTHILLVEDEADHVELIRRGLQGHGLGHFDLSVVATLAEARAALEKKLPDLMIVDYRLPDGEGVELLPGSFEKREYPIIVMTGHGDQKLAVNALKAGAIDYIVKTESTMADMANICGQAMGEWHTISERRQTLRQLTARESLIKRIFQAAPTGIFMLVKDKLTFVNDHLCCMLGYRVEELEGKYQRMLFPSEEEYRRCQRITTDQMSKDGVGSIETQFKGKDGNIIDVWLGSAPVDSSDAKAGTTFTALDITARKKMEADMRFMASHDSLTGLANRSLFMDRLTGALAMSARQKSGVTVMFIDLDDFKRVNDSLGHEVGDIVLQQAAARIIDCLRASDSTSRFGGDEFLILLPMTAGREAAAGVAEKIIASMQHPFKMNNQEISLSCSVGVSLFPEHGDCPESLINKADAAMYEAKQGGKNGYRFAH